MLREKQYVMQVSGRNLLSGLPREIGITSNELTDAMDEPMQTLLENIHNVTQMAPSELISDIYNNGMILTGGGSRLMGLASEITRALKITCLLPENPQACIANGCAMVLENPGLYGQFLDSKRRH